MQAEGNNVYEESSTDGIEIKKLIFKYLKYWPWFLICIIAAIVVAFLYLRYSTPVYKSTTQIQVLEESESGVDLSGLDATSALFNMSEINLENEMYILRSRLILKGVLEKMGINTFYYSEDEVTSKLLFGKQIPFQVHWVHLTELEEGPPHFYLQFEGTNKFSIHTEEESSQTYSLSDTITMAEQKFTLELLPQNIQPTDTLRQSSFSFFRMDTTALLSRLSDKIVIQPLGEDSEILGVSMTGPNEERNEGILNTLVQEFNRDAVEDDRIVAKRTAEFIEKRLKTLSKELDTVETNIVDYKQKSDLFNIKADAKQLFEKEGQAEKKRLLLENQLQIAQYFREELKTMKKYSFLPAKIGMEESSISQLIGKYNDAVFKLKELSVSATPENQMILAIKDRIASIFDDIKKGVNNYIEGLKYSLQKFRNVEQFSAGRLAKLPKKQKKLRVIKRRQKVKEKLYLFLLQRREEALLSYAVTAPTIKVVEFAYTTPNPIKPKSRIILLAALILGLLVPFGVLYLKFMMDTKLKDRDQLEKGLSDTPVLTELPFIKKGGHKLVKPNDRTALGEAFRILRTNLVYFKIKNKKEEGQVTFVTSSTKGEGKTFTAVNLANTWAAAGKKTLLLGADLRNPQTHTYLGLSKNRKGLVNYLYDPDTDVNDIIFKDPFEFEDLDLVIAGEIPPNPAELLLNGQFGKLLEVLKTKYDHIVVDTAPTLLVTDTMLISEYADMSVYMTRANYTDTRLLEHIQALKKEEKIKSMGVVLNGVKERSGYGYRYGYNYGYGYGYGADSERSSPSWKFWKK